MSNTKPTKLFAKQRQIYPKRVWGRYRKIKWVVMIITLAIYYLAPWIRFDRGDTVSNQAILIDIVHSRGYFFFIEIWPQEIYYIVGILVLAAVGLFFVTSLLGRVWCGYACPQTVWTDLFVWVERIVQGDRNTRMKRDKGPMNFDKFWRKIVTHSIWLLIGLLTGGAWVFYFNDAPTLVNDIINFEVPWSILSWVIALTLSTYLMAGFAREQVCTYMCPYARFQSAMFDKDTLLIGYDKQRGEPRGSHKQGENWENRGHCIDCTACVQVCPVGIDIRDGLQMECIACGLCVDACNNVMDKVGLPHGLIRYDTLRNQQYRILNKGKELSLRLLRPRTFYYSAIILVVGGLMLYNLLNRSSLEINVMHERSPLFITMSDGSIRNGYEVKILNKSHSDKIYRLDVNGTYEYEIKIQSAKYIRYDELKVFANSVGHFKVFLTTKPGEGYKAKEDLEFIITDNETGTKEQHKSFFVTE